jgi:hypothetical protein
MNGQSTLCEWQNALNFLIPSLNHSVDPLPVVSANGYLPCVLSRLLEKTNALHSKAL